MYAHHLIDFDLETILALAYKAIMWVWMAATITETLNVKMLPK